MQPDPQVLADQANAALTRMARTAATLTIALAVLGLLVAGSAYLIGFAALNGGSQGVWAVFGGLLVLGAVVAPLIAGLRLRAIPRHARELLADLRTLVDAGGDAREAVVETTTVDVVDPAGGQGRAVVTTVMPSMGRLRASAAQIGAVTHLHDALARLAVLPFLIVLAVTAMLMSLVAGFVLFWIWVF